MRFGSMRQRVNLLSRSETVSDAGQPSTEWTAYAAVYGAPKTMLGSQFYSQTGTQNTITMELSIHYRKGVRPGDRVEIAGEQYEIAAPPENVGLLNRELLLRLRHVE